jgi:zinc transporter 2
VGVIGAGIIITVKPDWKIVDPLCTFLFSILVVCTTKKIVHTGIMIIMEATP